MARPRLVSDQQMLDATRAAVSERGAHVSLDDVAQHLEISAPALLKRFGSRQNLLLAALSPDLNLLNAIFEEPEASAELASALELVIVRLGQYFHEAMPRLMALRECVSHDVLEARIKGPVPLHAINGLKRWFKVFERRGLIEGEMMETVATAIVGAVVIRIVSAHLAQQQPLRKAQRKFETELTALFTRALRPAARTRIRQS